MVVNEFSMKQQVSGTPAKPESAKYAQAQNMHSRLLNCRALISHLDFAFFPYSDRVVQ